VTLVSELPDIGPEACIFFGLATEGMSDLGKREGRGRVGVPADYQS